jgi:predicted helicase
MDDFWKKEEKLAWFAEHEVKHIEFENITPDKNNNWINNSEFETLMPLADKVVKTGQSNEAIIKLFCWGNSSNRDEWVYDFNNGVLEKKMRFFSETFNDLIVNRKQILPSTIKWSNDLKSKLNQGKEYVYDKNKSTIAFWRPFTKQYLYAEKIINDRLTDNHYQIFGPNLNKENLLLMITNHPQTEFLIHAVNKIADAGYGSRATQMFPLYRYTSTGERIYNITDWAVEQFTKHYSVISNEAKRSEKSPDKKSATEISLSVRNDELITKENIFHYVYAVLHNPAYRKKYELNLKREFPRIPFYDNFYQWVKWGEQLMNLHIGYETAEPYPLNVNARNEAISNDNSNNEIARLDESFGQASSQPNTKPKAPRKDVQTPKAKLKALKDIGVIVLDDNTELHGIPKQAWDYKLGNRSALEWILDQYKEKKPSDPTIAEKFNTYKFADYKEQVIDLLKRVCTVSVETMKVVGDMEQI